MSEPSALPDPTPLSEAATDTLVFEHPLNERMRTFLRLDFLYNQAKALVVGIDCFLQFLDLLIRDI